MQLGNVTAGLDKLDQLQPKLLALIPPQIASQQTNRDLTMTNYATQRWIYDQTAAACGPRGNGGGTVVAAPDPSRRQWRARLRYRLSAPRRSSCRPCGGHRNGAPATYTAVLVTGPAPLAGSTRIS